MSIIIKTHWERFEKNIKSWSEWEFNQINIQNLEAFVYIFIICLHG